METEALGFNAEERTEIFSATFFMMDLDFRQFMLLDQNTRDEDAGRFVRLNGVRYAILSKVVGEAKDDKSYEEMRRLLDRAGEIMLVARGVKE